MPVLKINFTDEEFAAASAFLASRRQTVEGWFGEQAFALAKKSPIGPTTKEEREVMHAASRSRVEVVLGTDTVVGKE